MSGYTVNRFEGVVSANACSVDGTAVKVSGGSTALTVAGITGGIIPSARRQGVVFTNNHATQNLFLGHTAGVTTTTGWFKRIVPNEMFEYLANGGVNLWVIGSGAATLFQMDELE